MVKIIDAIDKSQYDIELDEKGYFIIRTCNLTSMIYADFYNYEKEMLLTIQGKDARSIYWTIIENDLIASISHAAYLGKELAMAEQSLQYGYEYVQK